MWTNGCCTGHQNSEKFRNDDLLEGIQPKVVYLMEQDNAERHGGLQIGCSQKKKKGKQGEQNTVGLKQRWKDLV